MILLIGEGFIEEFEDTAKDKECEVIFCVGDGLLVVGDGGGGLEEGGEDCGGLAVSDVVGGLFVETGGELGD